MFPSNALAKLTVEMYKTLDRKSYIQSILIVYAIR